MAPRHPALEQDRRAPHQRLPHAHRLAHRPRRHPAPLRRHRRSRLLRRRRPAIDAEFRSPHDIAQDVHGNIVINDISNFVYRRIDAETGIIETIIGSGKLGRGGHGGPATEAEMDTHCGVAVAENGDIYVSSEWTNNISRVDAETGIIELFARLRGATPPLRDGRQQALHWAGPQPRRVQRRRRSEGGRGLLPP